MSVMLFCSESELCFGLVLSLCRSLSGLMRDVFVPRVDDLSPPLSPMTWSGCGRCSRLDLRAQSQDVDARSVSKQSAHINKQTTHMYAQGLGLSLRVHAVGLEPPWTLPAELGRPWALGFSHLPHCETSLWAAAVQGLVCLSHSRFIGVLGLRHRSSGQS